MPPNSNESGVIVLDEETAEECEYKGHKLDDEQVHKPHGYFLSAISWPDAFAIVFLHVVGIYRLLTFPILEKFRVFFFCKQLVLTMFK